MLQTANASRTEGNSAVFRRAEESIIALVASVQRIVVRVIVVRQTANAGNTVRLTGVLGSKNC